MPFVIIVLQAVISAAGVLLIRSAALSFETAKSFTGPVLVNGILGILAYGTSFILWVLILGKFHVAYAFPITIGISLLVTTLGAYLLFGEIISLIQSIGLVLLVVAVAMIGVGAAT